MGRPAGSQNKAKSDPVAEAEALRTMPPAQVAASMAGGGGVITLTIPADALHGPEGLQAVLQEWLDTAAPGEVVRWQVR